MPIARARAARFTRATPQSASAVSHVLYQKISLLKSNHGPKLWASQNIFASHYLFAISQIWPYRRHNPMQRPHAPAWQASPWEHRPSSSAPCAVPMRLSRIGQHIKDEPCAKQRSLLGVFSSRSSSVFRGVRSAYPIYFGLPLVGIIDRTKFRVLVSDWSYEII